MSNDYDVFISYSRSDIGFARRFKSTLERYRPPRSVRLDKKRLKVFLDEDDIVGNDLGDELRRSIENTKYLVVLCSPNSRSSSYVSLEIDKFAAVHGRDRIILVLISGRPNTEVAATDPDQDQAFSDALYRYLDEPLAADFRELANESYLRRRKRHFESKFQVLAALFGTDKESLIGRQRARARQRAVILTAVVAVLAGIGIKLSEDAKERAMIASVTNTASQTDDPLIAALLLMELRGTREPPGGMNIAHEVAASQRAVAILRGHDATVTSVAFSPDSSRLITASKDHTARVWSADGRGEPVVLHGHTDELTDASFSRDGLRIATASADATVRIYDARASGADVVLRGHSGAVFSVAFDASGSRVLTSSGDGTARLWNADGSGAAKVIEGIYAEDVDNVVFSADATRFATGGADGTVQVWDVLSTARPIAVYAILNPVSSLEFSNDDTRLAATSTHGLTTIWELDGGSEHVIGGPDTYIGYDAALTPEGNRLLTFGADNLRLWQLENNVELAAIDESAEFGRKTLAISPDGGHVALVPIMLGRTASGMRPGLQLWTLTDDELLDPIDLPGGAEDGTSIVFSPDGALVAAGLEDGTARIWRVNPPQPTRLPIQAHTRHSMDFNFARSQIANASERGRLEILELRPKVGKPVLVSERLENVTTVKLSPDGNHVAAILDNGSARLWPTDGTDKPLILYEPLTGSAAEMAADRIIAEVFGFNAEPAKEQEQDELIGPPAAPIGTTEDAEAPLVDAPVRDLAFSSDSSEIVLGLSSGVLVIVPVSGTGQPITLGETHGPPITVKYLADDSKIVSVSKQGAVSTWDTSAQGAPVFTFNIDHGLEFSAINTGGSRILTVSDSTVDIWRDDGVLSKTFAREGVLGFDSDLTRVARAFEDGTFELWRAEQPDEVTRITGHAGPITDIAFSADGKQLATISKDGAVKIWRFEVTSEPISFNLGKRISAIFDLHVWFWPDGESILTGQLGALTKLWRIGWDPLLENLRASTTICLSAADRVRYLNETPAQARVTYVGCEESYGRRVPASAPGNGPVRK